MLPAEKTATAAPQTNHPCAINMHIHPLLTHVMAMCSLPSSPSPSSLRALGPDEEAGAHDLGVGGGVRGVCLVSQHGRSGEWICRMCLHGGIGGWVCSGGVVSQHGGSSEQMCQIHLCGGIYLFIYLFIYFARSTCVVVSGIC